MLIIDSSSTNGWRRRTWKRKRGFLRDADGELDYLQSPQGKRKTRQGNHRMRIADSVGYDRCRSNDVIFTLLQDGFVLI